MNVEKNKDGKKIIIVALLAAVLIMAVGYAAFASTLTVNGNAEILGQWDVEITGVKVKQIIGKADVVDFKNTKTSFTFDTDLYAPGDTVVFEISVENNGSIDATIANFEMTPQSNGSPAIIYEYTEPGTTIKAGQETSFTVTVKFDENAVLPVTNTTKTIFGIVEYKQAD